MTCLERRCKLQVRDLQVTANTRWPPRRSQGNKHTKSLYSHCDLLPQLSMGQTYPQAREIGALLMSPFHSIFQGKEQGQEWSINLVGQKEDIQHSTMYKVPKRNYKNNTLNFVLPYEDTATNKWYIIHSEKCLTHLPTISELLMCTKKYMKCWWYKNEWDGVPSSKHLTV